MQPFQTWMVKLPMRCGSMMPLLLIVNTISLVNNRFGGIAVEPLHQAASIGYADIWNGIAAAFFRFRPNLLLLSLLRLPTPAFVVMDKNKDSVIRKGYGAIGRRQLLQRVVGRETPP